VVHVVTDDAAAAACPVCGVFCDKVRQCSTTKPKDLGYGEEALAVHWRKVQYACRELLCPRKAFTESNASVAPGSAGDGAIASGGSSHDR